jgi:hypothetical protein
MKLPFRRESAPSRAVGVKIWTSAIGAPDSVAVTRPMMRPGSWLRPPWTPGGSILLCDQVGSGRAPTSYAIAPGQPDRLGDRQIGRSEPNALTHHVHRPPLSLFEEAPHVFPEYPEAKQLNR